MLSLKNGLYEKIQFVNELGYNVILFQEDIFVYSTFDASTSGHVSSVDYCSFKGICMTDWFTVTQVSELVRRTELANKFRNKMDSLQPVNVKFNKTIEWVLFSTI